VIQLSKQQWECVRLVAEGFPDKAIAAELGLQYGTVKQHLLCARNRVGATNRTELAVLYVRGDIVPPGGVTA